MSIWTDIFGIRKPNAQFFTFTGDKDTPAFHIDFDCEHGGNLKAYYDCSILRTVVSRNAQAMANGKWWVIRGSDMTGDDVSGSYPTIAALLARPNPEQEWGEFVIQAEVYRQVFGHLYIYASAPEGFNTTYAERLWALAPNEVMFTRDGMATVTLDEETITVPADRICEVKDTGKFTTPILGSRRYSKTHTHKSRVYSARHAIKNIIQAEESIYSINRDRGALGMLSVEEKDASGRVPLHPQEKENIEKQLQGHYGITGRKLKILFTNAALKWQQMSMSVRDLMLLEGMDKNMETLCNVFDYPKELLIAESKYSNKETAKGHYEEAVIPFSLIYASKLGRFLGLRPGDNFIIDFSHIPAMKEAEDQKSKVYYQKATAVEKLYKDGILSREEARLEMGYEAEIEGKTMFNQNDKNNGGIDSGANQSPEGQA